MGQRMALLVATYEYEDTGLRQLTAPAHDAEALAAVLADGEIAGFQVTTLINEPHYRVGESISELYRDRRRDDLTVLYFTCHGLKDDDGRLYLATVNSRRENLLFTSLPAEQIDQAMSACASHQRVLILDCCYGGAFPAGGAKGDTEVHSLDRFRGRGRAVLTASDAAQYAFEGDQAHGQPEQSVFTRYLVRGLRDGSADLDGDGDITIDELYTYVHDRVIDETPRQRPKRQDNVEGRIVIARNVNWVLPQYLRHALDSPISAERLTALDGLIHLFRIGNEQVRAQALAAIRQLTADDSRAVSGTAAERLRMLVPERPRPEPSKPVPPRPEPARPEPQRPEPAHPEPPRAGQPEAGLPEVQDTVPEVIRRPRRQRRRTRRILAALVILTIALAAILIALVSRHPAQVRAIIGIKVQEQNAPFGVGLCVIYAVVQGSAASQAGLEAGDVLTSLAGAAITTCTSVATILHGLHVGDTVPVQYVRGSATHTAEITLSGMTVPASSSPIGP